MIPHDTITMFTSDQLELIINGKPYIDVEEWKHFTTYKEPYYPTPLVIEWFWSVMGELTQAQLSHFLQFSTGTARVPIGGFSNLESNRGNIARFTIVRVP